VNAEEVRKELASFYARYPAEAHQDSIMRHWVRLDRGVYRYRGVIQKGELNSVMLALGKLIANDSPPRELNRDDVFATREQTIRVPCAHVGGW